MESRECEIRILNGTSCAFYRYMHLVKHGLWTILPPECLKGKSEEICMAKFTKTVGNFYGVLQYCVVINGEEYILNVRFDIPLLGDNVASVVLGMNIRNEKKQILSHQNYFIVKYTFDNTYNSKFFINIIETEEGKRFIEYHKKKLKKGLLRILKIRTLEEKEKDKVKEKEKEKVKMKRENDINNMNRNSDIKLNNGNENMVCSKLNNNYTHRDVLDTLPLSFIINVKNYDWKKRLRKSHKSLYILIINFTRQTLNLSDQKGIKSMMLSEGNWVEFPNEKIPSLRCAEFGCNSDGMFSSISGFCKYNFMNESCDLHVYWDINNVNSKIKCSIKNSTKYTVVKNVELFNECTAIFHILEYYFYPPIKILECRAITHNVVNKYNIEKQNIEKKLNIIYQCSINVLRQFCHYLHSNDAYKTSSNNENFINLIQFKTVIGTSESYEQCDYFKNRSRYSPDNTVKADSSLGGLQDQWKEHGNGGTNKNRLQHMMKQGRGAEENNDTYKGDTYNHSGKTNNSGALAIGSTGTYHTGGSGFFKNGMDGKFSLIKQKNDNVNIMYMQKNNIFLNVNITSCRDFFCYIHGNSYSNNIPINSFLYISWNIGNIIYRNLYNASEHIIINAHSLLSSQNMNDDVILKLRIDENNKKLYPSDLIHNLLLNTQSNIYINNEYVILDIILNTFHILSNTLSPIIEKILEAEYGSKWIKDSKIPKCNIWEKTKGVNELDIEGIMHIITTFWIDVFEKKIKNLQVIENLQRASIFWTNQEIDQFDQAFVEKLIESSSLLLKIFGDYNTAKSIENLYYNKYSIFKDISVD